MVETQLSSAEAELYDRQIRLWGIESQQKLRAANVLLIKVRGLGSEIAKDILLSGINSLTILDDGIVTKEELVKNFLLSQDSLEQNIAEAVLPKAQALNPLVKITADIESLSKKSDKYFAEFTMVIGTGLTKSQILTISDACRSSNVKLICGDNFGMFGYTISDLQDHTYFEDKVQLMGGQKKRDHAGKVTKVTVDKKTVKVSATLKYPDLADVVNVGTVPTKKRRNVYYYLMLALLEFHDKHSRNPSIATKAEDIVSLKEIKEKIFTTYQVDAAKLDDTVFNMIFGEVVPICSIVGGVIAQEVIKAVSGREVPINNVFLLDPFTYSGREETVGVTK